MHVAAVSTVLSTISDRGCFETISTSIYTLWVGLL